MTTISCRYVQVGAGVDESYGVVALSSDDSSPAPRAEEEGRRRRGREPCPAGKGGSGHEGGALIKGGVAPELRDRWRLSIAMTRCKSVRRWRRSLVIVQASAAAD